MSSVNSSSGSSSNKATDDAARKTREEYRKKEAEQTKRQAKQLRDLNQQHVKDIDKLTERQSQQVSDIKTKARESLSAKDMKYQKEMDSMRQAHSKQVEKLVQDSQTKLEQQRRTSDLQISQSNMGTKERVRSLDNQYDRQLAGEREKFDESLAEVRQRSAENLAERQKRMGDNYRKELDLIRDNRNEVVTDLRSKYKDLQQLTSEQLKDQEIKHFGDRQRISDNAMDNIRRKEESHNDVQAMTRRGQEDAIDTLKDKYAEAHQRETDARNTGRQNFEEEIRDRVSGQVNRLERDLASAKDKNVRDEQRVKMDAKAEVRKMAEVYQDKFAALEQARTDTVKDHNEINARDIQKIQDQAQRQMVENSRYYQGRMDVENFRNRQAYDSLEADVKMREHSLKDSTDNRIQAIRQNSFHTEEKIRNNFKDNLDLMKMGREDETREMVLKHNKEKAQITEQMKLQIQKAEGDHQRRMEDVVSKYEKRISDLNDQIMKDKRNQGVREKQLVRELKRTHEGEIEAMRVRYESQNKQAQVQHEKEVREVSRRHEAKLDDVLTSLKKS